MKQEIEIKKEGAKFMALHEELVVGQMGGEDFRLCLTIPPSALFFDIGGQTYSVGIRSVVEAFLAEHGAEEKERADEHVEG